MDGEGTDQGWTLKVHASINRIPKADWDACANIAAPDFNPFVRHDFFSALEDSGCATADSGWLPQHLTVEDANGRIVACAPLYLKNHSYGEYVFDWGWAQAYERAGGRYYPKLQCAVPFTPVTGPRLMIRAEAADVTRMELQHTLLAGMVELAQRTKVSSVHITFATEAEYDLMDESGFLSRIGEQYHWKNEGYTTFDDFLAKLASRKRKAIRHEREKANTCGVKIDTLVGADVKSHHWDAFFKFYMNTSDRKWGQAYLNREFFDLLSQRMGEAVVMVMGEENGRPVCGALNLRGGDTLFGRNWGTLVHHPMLHFELCYYRAIDFAIAHKLAWVEAGAQGEHKVQRGYLPRATYSGHWIADRGFRGAVADFLDRERAAIIQDIAATTELGPFKRSG